MSELYDLWYDSLVEKHFEDCDECSKIEADGGAFDMENCPGFQKELEKGAEKAEEAYWDNVDRQIDQMKEGE